MRYNNQSQSRPYFETPRRIINFVYTYFIKILIVFTTEKQKSHLSQVDPRCVVLLETLIFWTNGMEQQIYSYITKQLNSFLLLHETRKYL